MNRRGFLQSMIRAGVGAMILLSAVTYARQWVKPKRLWRIELSTSYCISQWDTVVPSPQDFKYFFGTLFKEVPRRDAFDFWVPSNKLADFEAHIVKPYINYAKKTA